ncbi:replication associated protein [Myodefec virus RodL3_773]|uniref:Replication-associated protein n=1 Tax=Myodefec virus RodL3_773 TaxID=2929258 RepID=A0A976N2E1_9VIRU|nr:replication associated protein [Myodefec virus RodL3_773]
MTQARCWCGTLNSLPDNFDAEAWIKEKAEKCKFIVGQLEMGHETEHQHLQFYVQLSRSQRLNWLKRNISEEAHWEAAKGTAKQCYDYCTKEDTRVAGPWQVGEWATQGQTRGLSQAVECINSGGTLRDVAEQFPEVYIRHARGLKDWVHTVGNKGPRQIGEDGPEVWVFWGRSGTGKSRRARDDWPEAYWKLNNARWWDGYAGHETVIFDDFKGSSLTLHDFQRIIDRYPIDVEVKGGTTPLSATRYVFTSNKHPADWYSAEADPEGTVMRRVNEFCADRGRLIHFVGAPGTATQREATPEATEMREGFAEVIPDWDTFHQ